MKKAGTCRGADRIRVLFKPAVEPVAQRSMKNMKEKKKTKKKKETR